MLMLNMALNLPARGQKMLSKVAGGEWVCPCLFDELIDRSLATA